MIKLDDVAHVYRGKARRCCCGCAGRHVYPSKYRDMGSKRRGYAISDNEVDDTFVENIVARMNRRWAVVEDCGDHWYYENKTEQFIAYKVEHGPSSLDEIAVDAV